MIRDDVEKGEAGGRVLAGALGLAVLAASAPAAPAADIPDGRGARVTLEKGWPGVEGAFERRRDKDLYKVELDGGRDYAFHVLVTNVPGGCARLNLRNAKGKVLESALGHEGSDSGFEFRPGGRGRTTFLVEFAECSSSPGAAFPLPYRGGVARDARGDAGTKATIAVGQTVNGVFSSSDDRDWFRTNLEKGVKYTVTLESDIPNIALADARGVKLFEASEPATLAGVSVPRSGLYYLVLDDDADNGRRYTLHLKKN